MLMSNRAFLLCLKIYSLLHVASISTNDFKKMMNIEIFKQNVMIRERIDQKSFHFRECE